MSAREKVQDMECHIYEIEEAVKALHSLADDLPEPKQAIVRFLAHYLEGLHGKLWPAYEAAHAAFVEEPCGPRLVDNGGKP